MELRFGKHKGKTLEQCPADYLQWLRDNTNPNDEKWGEKNQMMIDEINVVLTKKEFEKPAEVRTPKFDAKNDRLMDTLNECKDMLIEIRNNLKGEPSEQVPF